MIWKTNSNSMPIDASKYGFAGVRIQIDEQNPDTRCTYPKTLTVNGKVVDNSAYGLDPAYNQGGENQLGNTGRTAFNMGDWAKHPIVKNIKPVYKDGDTWGDLDKTDQTQWSTDYDCFTEFPFNWLSITNNGTYINIIFSDNDSRPDSTFQCYAFAKGCDSYSNQNINSALANVSRQSIMSSDTNNYFANQFHIGCFEASGGQSGQQIYSKRNSDVSDSTFGYCCQGANQRGTDYDCMSFQQWTYLQALFVLLYKSTDSQTRHSHGYISDDNTTIPIDISNQGISTTQYGMAGQVGVKQINSFFWINNIWGNLACIVGGMWIRANSSDSKLVYYWLPRQANSRAFNNGWTQQTTQATQQSLGTSTGTTSDMTQTTIKTVSGTNLQGFIPLSGGGSMTTYFADYGNCSTSSTYANFARVAGYTGNSGSSSANNQGLYGIFYMYISQRSTQSLGDVYTQRLSYRGGHW